MGFYIRKGINIGPVRLNVSKSGIGFSVGVKGARIATGPRGTYVHMGRKGIYYRQRIDGSMAGAQPATPRDSEASPDNDPHHTETGNVADLVESSHKDTLAQINSRIQQSTSASAIGVSLTVIAGGTGLLALAVMDSSATLGILLLIVAGITWFKGIGIALATREQEKLARETTLQYNLDADTKAQFGAVQNALDTLAKSASIWQVVSDTPTVDRKRQAGATSVVKRKPIKVESGSPPFIKTQVRIYSLTLETMRLFFLPDQIFVFQNGLYGAVSYGSLRVRVSPINFIEDGRVPGDSQVVDRTWRYVRKDGGPDMRFAGNYQMPIVRYGHIELSSATGLELDFHVSNLSYARHFAQTLSEYIQYHRAPSAKSSDTASSSSRAESSSSQQQRQYRQERARKEPTRELPPKDETPYTVLNVSPDASWEEISAAYREMVQKYHPDKVAGLAPEYLVIAEKRMKAINAAYEQLKRNRRQ